MASLNEYFKQDISYLLKDAQENEVLKNNIYLGKNKEIIAILFLTNIEEERKPFEIELRNMAEDTLKNELFLFNIEELRAKIFNYKIIWNDKLLKEISNKEGKF